MHHTHSSGVVAAEGYTSALPSLPFDAPASFLPVPANENMKVKADWMTPAEALQAVLRIKRRLQNENRQSHVLLMSAHRRKIWDEVQGCEQCLRWKYFRNLSA